MTWNTLHACLEKYRNLLPPDDTLRKAFLTAVQEHTGLLLSKEAVKVKNDVYTISGVSPSGRLSIEAKKQRIFEEVRVMTKKRDTFFEIRWKGAR